MTAPDWFYFVVAVMLYVVVYFAVEYALRPKPEPFDPDWFWDQGGGRWMPLPTSVGWVESTKPEQTDPQESKPGSGAG